MKGLTIVALLLFVSVLIVLSVSCSSGPSGSSALTSQIATAQVGDIKVVATGTGNLALEK